MKTLSEQAHQALNQGAQMLEYRLDSLKEIDYQKLNELLDRHDVPTIISARSHWYKTEIEPPIKGREETLLKILELEPQYIDLEYPLDTHLLSHINGRTIPIISLLDFEGMAKIAFDSILSVIKKFEGKILVKISATPNNVDDLKQLWRWGQQLTKNKIPHIVIGMGQLAQISRVKSRELGNQWTYGRISKKLGEPYLPGMLSIKNLKNAFSDNAWHLASLGQLPDNDILKTIYTELLRVSGLSGVFMNLPIQTSPQLDQMLLWAADGLLDGFNITSPWQVNMIPKLDQKDASVIQMNACNTVNMTKGGLKGYNTQIEGFRRSIEPYSLKRIKRVFIEGTEQIARAAIIVLRDFVDTIVVRNRMFSQIDKIFDDFPEIISASESYADDFDLIINCTLPDKGFENVVMLPKSIIQNAKLIFDPMSKLNTQTPLIRTARKLNKEIIGGFEFFFNTALSSFELWTKRSIPSSSINKELFDIYRDQIDTGFMLNY